VILRPALPEEAEPLARLLAAAFLEYVRGLGREASGPYDWLPERIAAGEVHVAADPGGRVLGMLALTWDAGEQNLVVDLLAVDPLCQGQGTGRALLAHAETLACARDARALRLHTVARYEHLVRLYTGAGYAVTHLGPRPKGEDDGHPRAFLMKPLRTEIGAA